MNSSPPKEIFAYADWLVNHMVTVLRIDPNSEQVWVINLRTPDVARMHSLDEALQDEEFMVATVKELEEVSIDADGNSKTNIGGPLVSAHWTDSCDPASIKQRIKQILEIAEQHAATDPELDSMTPEEFDSIFGPPRAQPIEFVLAHLANMDLLVLPEGEAIPFELDFAVEAEDVAACKAGLKNLGYNSFEEPPPGADWTLTVNIAGVRGEEDLHRVYAKLQEACGRVRASLKGMVP